MLRRKGNTAATYPSAFLTFSLLGMLALATGTTATNASEKYLHFKVQPILDKRGFYRPVTAGFILKPVGWTFQGGVEWKNQYSCTWGHATEWQVTSPDQRYSLAALSHQRWYYSSNPNPKYARPSCGFMPYQQRVASLEGYLRLRLHSMGLKSRNIRYNPYPVPPFLQNNTYERQLPGGARQKGWVEVGDIVFQFDGPNGEMEGRLGGVANLTRTTAPGVPLQLGMRIPSVETGSGYVYFLHVSVVPAGEQSPRVFETIIRTTQHVAEYHRAILQHNSRMDEMDRIGIWRVGQITHKANQEIFRIIQSSWKNRQASMDRSFEGFLDVINEVTPYEDPNDPNKQIKANIRYDSVWKMDDGTYVFGEGAGFDPRQRLGVGGVELKRARSQAPTVNDRSQEPETTKHWLQHALPVK